MATVPWLIPRAAYIHVPFCAHRCGYCDFAVAAGQDALIDPYVDSLVAELSNLGRPTSVQTIFVGGGTPTHLPDAPLRRLLEAVQLWLPLSPGGEFSVEANPENITAEKVATLADHGVNRVSLGVQTFSTERLGRLDRIHGPEHVGPAVDRLRYRIDNVSLDLIFGIAGETLDEWQADLETAVAYEPTHISTYGLTYEKGTRLWKQRARHQLTPLGEEAELAMYRRAMDYLPTKGFEQYEVSNFARTGFRCRHNEFYWANDAYYGFGVGAARYGGGKRELNVRNTAEYIRRMGDRGSATFQSETVTGREAAQETASIQFRRVEGIVRDAFFARTGFHVDDIVGRRLPGFAHAGLIEDSGTAIRLTPAGRCVADELIVQLIWR